MNKTAFILIMITILSCKKDNETIPANIRINDITLNEINTTYKITDAWVYVDDQLQGVYELPALFPVLNNGKHNLRIKAGIKNNGIAATRISYPFYTSFILENFEFVPNEIKTINPIVSYLDSTNYFVEDFEGIGINVSSTNISDTIINILNDGTNNYGSGILNDSLLTFEISTDDLTTLPQAGSPVFLELDYKSNTQFLVGVYINYSLVVKKELIWINPKENWNKIYIDLTNTISEGINAPSFSIFIGMKRDYNLDTNAIYFDNIRIIY